MGFIIGAGRGEENTVVNSNLIDEEVGQLLQEAGCTDAFTRQFLVVMETESVKDLLRLLRGQRSYQLNRLHEEEKKLDRLDYLRYKLEKQLPADTKPDRRRR